MLNITLDNAELSTRYKAKREARTTIKEVADKIEHLLAQNRSIAERKALDRVLKVCRTSKGGPRL
jgi:hypothetical protein